MPRRLQIDFSQVIQQVTDKTGKELESGFLYVGSPAKKLRELSEREMEFLSYSAKGYVDLKNQYMNLET